MEGAVFGGIQETARAGPVHGKELAPFRPAKTDVALLFEGSERAVPAGKTAVRLLAEARARYGSYHQRRLVAVLGRRASIDRFDGLNRIRGNLRGKEASLLIGDGLVIDRKSHLGVIAERMKEAIRVRHHGGSGKRDDVAEPGGDRGCRHLRKQLAIGIGVRGRRGLHERRLRRSPSPPARCDAIARLISRFTGTALRIVKSR